MSQKNHHQFFFSYFAKSSSSFSVPVAMSSSALKSLRSLHPGLESVYKVFSLPGQQLSYKNLISPSVCQNIIDKLNLRQKYPNSAKTLDILDVSPKYGLFSSMLNYELKPRTHILIENQKEYAEKWQEMINMLQAAHDADNEVFSGNYKLVEKSGYPWETFTQIIEQDKLITPPMRPRDSIHDELLLVANLSFSTGESLLAQWIMCTYYKNWIQKYGRVRMICLVPETTAVRFLSGPGSPKRNKSSIKRELFTDSHLVALCQPIISKKPIDPGTGYDPNLLYKDQPVIIPRNGISPSSGLFAIMEIAPKDNCEYDLSLLELFIQNIMMRSNVKAGDSMETFCPGVRSFLSERVPNKLLETPSKNLTLDEVMTLFEHFNDYPFKPDESERIQFSVDT